MRLAKFLPLILLVVSFSLPATQSKSYPEEKDSDRVVEFTSALEVDPLGDSAPAQRKWLLQWLTDTPDFTVAICDILGPIPNDPVPNGPALLVQQMFGNVAYQIQHPGVKDEASLQIAGTESVLRAYAAIIGKDPSAHIAYLDNLLSKQRAGTLNEHMAPIIAKGCTSGNGA
jgi:hypothetical protein